MNTAFVNALADRGAAVSTYIGLVDDNGVEISDGRYERLAPDWVAPSDGFLSMVSDLNFSIAAGTIVSGWRAFSALTGGTNYGGGPLTQVTFEQDGTYILEAASFGIDHVT